MNPHCTNHSLTSSPHALSLSVSICLIVPLCHPLFLYSSFCLHLLHSFSFYLCLFLSHSVSFCLILSIPCNHLLPPPKGSFSFRTFGTCLIVRDTLVPLIKHSPSFAEVLSKLTMFWASIASCDRSWIPCRCCLYIESIMRNKLRRSSSIELKWREDREVVAVCKGK